MNSTRRRALACSLTIALALAAAPATAGPTPKRRARVAVRYVVSTQRQNGSISAFSSVGSTADAIVAMAAARRGAGAARAALGWLRKMARAGRINGIGERAKVVAAVVAVNGAPRNFGGRNLVRALKGSERPSGRYGEGTAVFDHALVVLALRAAGAPVAARARSWLARAQCEDGGWQYDEPASVQDNAHCSRSADDLFTSDTNTTSLAVQALAAAPGANPVTDPFAYFRSARDPVARGWRYSHAAALGGVPVFSDSNSTALVLQAYAAAGRPRPAGSRKALLRLQYRLCGELGGAFAFTWERTGGRLRRVPGARAAALGGATVVGATIGAVPGVLGKPLSALAPTKITRPAPSRPPCS